MELSVYDRDTALAEWSWAEFEALPQTSVKVDIHCVTTWSKLDAHWQGVTIDTLLDAAGLSDPPTSFTMIHSDGDYSTNIPIEDLIEGKAMIATRYEGNPLAPEHGGPARLLVPHLYFWKSAKWAWRLQFITSDRPGFWRSSAITSMAIRGVSSAMPETKVDISTPKRLTWKGRRGQQDH